MPAVTFAYRGSIFAEKDAIPLLCTVFAAALAMRLSFALMVPFQSGDWPLYRDVARNILSGCGVAVTGPAGCAPHFGGNQLPLFPAFVAVLWYVVGPSEMAVRIAQSIVASLSVAWLAYAVLASTRSHAAGYAAGGLLAFSVAQAFWAGGLQTETLALASTQWVLAELLLSFAAGRFRVGPVGIAMVAATWARLDGILLLVPVAAAAFAIGGTRKGLRAAFLVALITGTPLAAWAVRNVGVGISPFPIYGVMPDGTAAPTGYVAWLNTWVATARQHADTGFFGPSHYERIKVDPEAYHDAAERAEVEALLARLRTVSGQPFPPDIDAAFSRLAGQRRAEQTFLERAQRDGTRAWALMKPWIWDQRPPTDNPLTGVALFVVVFMQVTRLAVVAGFALTAGIGAFSGPGVVRFLAGLSALYVVTRLVFFIGLAGIEYRYMIELAPFIESTAAVGVGLLLVRIHRRGYGLPADRVPE